MQWAFELKLCSASKSPLHCLGQTRALLSISMCATSGHSGTFLSWAWFQKNSLSCLHLFSLSPLCFPRKKTFLCWCLPPPAGGSGEDMHGSLQACEEQCHTLHFLADWLGIQLHPVLLPGPLVGGHSSVRKLSVLFQLS